MKVMRWICKLAAIAFDVAVLNFNAENSRDLMQIILQYMHTMYYGHGIMAHAARPHGLFIVRQYAKILLHSEHVRVILTPTGITTILLIKRPYCRCREQVRIGHSHSAIPPSPYWTNDETNFFLFEVTNGGSLKTLDLKYCRDWVISCAMYIIVLF